MNFPRCKVKGCLFTATHAPTVVVRLGGGRGFECVLDILLCHEHSKKQEASAVLTPRSLADIEAVIAAQVAGPFEIESLFVRMDRRPMTPSDVAVRRTYLAPCAPVGGTA